MVLKQRSSLQQQPKQQNQRNSDLSCSISSISSRPDYRRAVSLPYGDGRVSPKARGPRYSPKNNNSSGGSRKSPSFFGKEYRPSSSIDTSMSSFSESENNNRRLSPTFFHSSSSSSVSSSSPTSNPSSSSASSKAALSTKKNVLTVLLPYAAACIAAFFLASKASQLRAQEQKYFDLQIQHHILRSTMLTTQNALDDANKNIRVMESKTKELDAKNRELQEEVQDKKAKIITSMNGTVGNVLSVKGDETEITNLLLRRQDAMRQRIEMLQNQIREISHREALERFGPGPHRVQFLVEFEYGKGTKVKSSTFTLELAPLDVMPHSVHLFLQMVAHQLWDGTVFLHTAHHVLQASPTDYDTGDSKRQTFDMAGLSHLSFQEYSDQYPHEKYTVGFGGRPGGPDFYISTQDNTKYHGPGGQGQHDLSEEADPCFGRIVEGLDVINRLHRLSVNSVREKTRSEDPDGDIRLTKIISARIQNS